MSVSPRAAAPSPSTTTARRRAMWASFLGTTIEFYDFALYGIAAALVFPAIFFVELEPLAAVLASFSTLAVGYIARPVGGIVFGHLGDKLGRKRVLVITLLLMGVASFLIGLLPTYAQIGVAAPIVLVLLRLVQGFAVGGEWAGAALLSMEHATERRRGFAGSLAAAAGPAGSLLAVALIIPVSMLPPEQFLGWGWRIPFLLSVVLVIIALVMRLRVRETEDFSEVQARREAGKTSPRIPLLTMFKHNTPQVVVGIVGVIAPLFLQSILATFMLTFAVMAGHAMPTVLIMGAVASLFHAITIPLFALLSDRIGRKPVLVVGALLGAVLIWPMFALVMEGSTLAMLAGFLLGGPLAQAMMYGPLAAWLGEKFAADVRYTGVAVTYQLGTMVGAGFAPMIATALLAAGGMDPFWVCIVFGILCVISAAVYLIGRDTFKSELPVTTGAVVAAADEVSVTA